MGIFCPAGLLVFIHYFAQKGGGKYMGTVFPSSQHFATLNKRNKTDRSQFSCNIFNYLTMKDFENVL